MSKDNYSSCPSRGRSDDPPRQQGGDDQRERNGDQRERNGDGSLTQEGVDLTAGAENNAPTISTLLLAIMDSSLLAIRASSSQRSTRPTNSSSASHRHTTLATDQQHIIDLIALLDSVLGLLEDDQHPTLE
jgi:hypothetical protein